MKKSPIDLVAVFFLFALCHCSTKHQPIAFTPYFPERPESVDVNRIASERGELEQKNELSLLEKKRWLDLYSLEVKRTSTETAEYQKFLGFVEENRTLLEPVYGDLDKVKNEVLGEQIRKGSVANTPKGLEDEKLKRRYRDVLKIWSRDENEKALEVVRLLTEEAQSAGISDRMKLLALAFRIAMDLGKVKEAGLYYDQMKGLDKCSPDTAQAGFIMSLSSYSNGDSSLARELLLKQCEPDQSTFSVNRRNYWLYRFGDASESPETRVARLKENGGFYWVEFLAHDQALFELPRRSVPIYLEGDFSVSASVHETFLAAEVRLRSNLRKDATWYLLKLSQKLRTNPRENLIPLLYTASLFRAAGNHLESIRILSDLSAASAWNAQEREWIATEFQVDFPRPFESYVEPLARDWGVDSDLVYALMRQESAFNPTATSSASARGLMQMMPFLAKHLSKQWSYRSMEKAEGILFHAQENLKLSIFHLQQLSQMLPHPALIAAAYNAGLQRTMRWVQRFGHLPLDAFIEMIPVNETRTYVKLVLRNLAYYKALKNGGKTNIDFIPQALPGSETNIYQKAADKS